MKTQILATALCIVSMIGVAAAPKAGDWAPKAGDWVTPFAEIPKGFAHRANPLANDHFYECQITRLGSALQRLKMTSSVELTDEQATYLAGHSYKPRAGHKSYLVRGVFANYTGGFGLYFMDSILLIQHSSLGDVAVPQFCPLIVQLPEPPKKVFIHISCGS